MTGILYSLDSQSIERRAFKETGLFQEAFEKKQTLFCNNSRKTSFN